jgi:hypothetical protein
VDNHKQEIEVERQLEVVLFSLYAQNLLAAGNALEIRAIEKGFRAAALKDGDAAFRAFLSSIEPECLDYESGPGRDC